MYVYIVKYLEKRPRTLISGDEEDVLNAKKRTYEKINLIFP